jgi:hypothetical protein
MSNKEREREKMTAPTLTYPQLIALSPCKADLSRIERLIGDARTWNGRPVTAAEAVAKGATFDDLIWVASKIARTNKDVERRLRLLAADCAARVLPIFEKVRPDKRVREYIKIVRRFARGEATQEELDAARAAARAARDAEAAAWDAGDAARAAGDAAARAARAARDARAARAAGAAWAAWDAERAWQLTRLVARLSEAEPGDWPLEETK